MARSRFPSKFFTDAEKETIRRAIESAEASTSGEIRVHVDPACAGDPLQAARDWFDRLGMRATSARNGVLLYLAIADRKMALYGDEGIDGVLPEGSWERLRDGMLAEFKNDRFAEGIAAAVVSLGETLKARFPRSGDADRNELADDLSASDD